MTKGEAAINTLGENANFDYALPQHWVDEMRHKGFDVRPHFVWFYGDSIWGQPMPITEQGRTMADQMGSL